MIKITATHDGKGVQLKMELEGSSFDLANCAHAIVTKLGVACKDLRYQTAYLKAITDAGREIPKEAKELFFQIEEAQGSPAAMLAGILKQAVDEVMKDKKGDKKNA